MDVLAACLFLGLAVTVGSNIPEIRDTIGSHSAKPYFGTVCYICTTALSFAVPLWLITLALVELIIVLQRYQ